jgi:maltooligosyltrehalose trehalohydrolase
MLAWYAALIALRRREHDLTDPRLDRVAVSYEEDRRWLVVSRGTLRIACNLAGDSQSIPLDGAVMEVLLESVAGTACTRSTVELARESVAVVRVEQ